MTHRPRGTRPRPARAHGDAAVLVLWVGYRAGRRVCRSLEAAGYRVVRGHPEGAPGAWGSRRQALVRYPSPTTDPDRFLDVVSETCRRERISAVLPCDEDIVRLLAFRGSEIGEVSVAGPRAAQYEALCDKSRLAQTAAALGVSHPRTVVVADPSSTVAMPAVPCIVKPTISSSHGLGAQAIVAGTTEEREEAVRSMVGAGVPALVQQLLTGPRWVGHCVAWADSMDFVGFRVDRDAPRGSGPASVMHTAPVPDGVRSATWRLLHGVGYVGPCSLSFIESGGVAHVHDVNLRLGRTVEASLHSGFDIPVRAVEAALGRPRRPLGAPRRTRFVRLSTEMKEVVRARGRVDESPPNLATWLVAGALRGQSVVDPSPFGPAWILRKAARLAERIATR